MSKRSSVQQPTTIRRHVPLLEKDNHGANVLMCPFCIPSHPITPFVASGCGTVVEVQAVQTVYRAKYQKGMVCVKCGKSGGMMVRMNDAFTHSFDCTPGTTTLTAVPAFSKIATWVFKMKDGRLKEFIQGFTGVAAEVKEVTPEGERTGVILGHFFHQRKKDNGKHTETNTSRPLP